MHSSNHSSLFAAMIPLWLFPLATAAGNSMVLKPSERDPGAAMILAELALEAGKPCYVCFVVAAQPWLLCSYSGQTQALSGHDLAVLALGAGKPAVCVLYWFLESSPC